MPVCLGGHDVEPELERFQEPNELLEDGRVSRDIGVSGCDEIGDPRAAEYHFVEIGARHRDNDVGVIGNTRAVAEGAVAHEQRPLLLDVREA